LYHTPLFPSDITSDTSSAIHRTSIRQIRHIKVAEKLSQTGEEGELNYFMHIIGEPLIWFDRPAMLVGGTFLSKRVYDISLLFVV
jgi:hypothetical protein